MIGFGSLAHLTRMDKDGKVATLFAHSMMNHRTPSTDGALPFAVGYREENPLSGIIILV